MISAPKRKLVLGVLYEGSIVKERKIDNRKNLRTENLEKHIKPNIGKEMKER